MNLDLALGGESPGWLYLPSCRGRNSWLRAIDERAEVRLVELHASGPRGELQYPADVPLPTVLSLGSLLRMIDEVTGSGGRVHGCRLALPAQRLALVTCDERSLRLEADSDEPFAECLDRLAGLGMGRWRRILAELRVQVLTERLLRLEAMARQIVVRFGEGACSEELILDV